MHRPTTGPVVAYACMTLAYIGYRLSEPLARTVDLMDLAEGRTVHGFAALVAFAPALSTLPRSMRSSSTASYDRAYPPARQ